MIQIDEIDQTLLHYLQHNSRTTLDELSRITEFSKSGIQKRIKRLQKRGIISQQRAIVDRQIFGYHFLCFVFITLHKRNHESAEWFERTMHDMPEVLECHYITGNADYLIKVIAHERGHLDTLLMTTLLGLDIVQRIKIAVVLKEIKESTVIPVLRLSDTS